MNLKTKRMICLLVAIISILTIVGTVSYAYFTAVGETRPQQATLSTATVSVRFSDNDTGISGELNFGESITKKFTIENTGTADANIKMSWIDMVNTYLEGSLTYTLSYSESEKGLYTDVISKTNVPQAQNPSKKTLASSLTIPVGKTYYYNLVITLNYLDDVNQDTDINATFHSKFNVEDINIKNIVEKIIASSQGVRTSFDDPATTDEGIFEMEDDHGTSYYFRGAVENNYVQFAGVYWRIIRVNGDGSLRIIYDGTSAHANGENNTDRFTHTSQAYNAEGNDNKYIGWMYSPNGTAASTSKVQAQTNSESSDIKKVVDAWYKTNIVDKGYSSVVSDEIFCNDRTTPGKESTGYSSDTGLGYGINLTAYGATARTGAFNSSTPNAPTFKCPQKNDAFTVDDTEAGNGALTYPVGLITADEVVAAGSGKFSTYNQKYYLYKGAWYWSFTPFYMYAGGYAYVFIVNATGSLHYTDVYHGYAVAPVINLSAAYAESMVGTGTMTDPYHAG